MVDIDGTPVEVAVAPRRKGPRYSVRLPVPALPAPVRVVVDVTKASRGWDPVVTAEVPECLRHRYDDGTLCMWWRKDDDEHRWTVTDGVTALFHHIRRHLFQEACCRAGESWPGDEAPGDHPRPSHCRTCGGRGA